MCRRVRISVLAIAVALAHGFSGVAQPEMGRYAGAPLQNPASLAGLWEAPSEHGGVVGLKVALSMRGKDIETIEFGLFERTGAEYSDLPFHSFTPLAPGADACHWDGHHLTIDFVPPPPKIKLTPEQEAMFLVTPVHVDLMWNESDGTWTGSFQYKSSRGQVVLRRPAPARPGGISHVVGNWINQGSGSRCLHLVAESDGKLNGWVDDIPAPDVQILDARNLAPRNMHTLPQVPVMSQYGDATRVTLEADGQLTVEFGAYSGMCCSTFFKGRLSADGTRLEGGSSGGALQELGNPNKETPSAWSRATSQACGSESAGSVAR